MRTTLTLVLLVALATPLAFAPGAAAAPVCQTLERVAPTPAATVTVRTDSCTDSFSGIGYTYQSWTNTTVVRSVDAAGYTTQVSTLSVHAIYTAGTQVYEERYHAYRAGSTDWDNAYLRNAYASAENYQSKSGGQCVESTGAGAGQYGPSSSTGLSHAFYGGSANTYVLPCTGEDVQNLLP